MIEIIIAHKFSSSQRFSLEKGKEMNAKAMRNYAS